MKAKFCALTSACFLCFVAGWSYQDSYASSNVGLLHRFQFSVVCYRNYACFWKFRVSLLSGSFMKRMLTFVQFHSICTVCICGFSRSMRIPTF